MQVQLGWWSAFYPGNFYYASQNDWKSISTLCSTKVFMYSQMCITTVKILGADDKKWLEEMNQ